MPQAEFSPGFFYSAGELVSRMRREPLTGAELIAYFTTILVCPPDEVLNLCLRCGWMKTGSDGRLSLSVRGEQLVDIGHPEVRLREQIRDYIVTEQPVWAKLVLRGRSEAAKGFHEDVFQVFDEAGLFSFPVADYHVTWWDAVSIAVRNIRSSAALETGRTGERMTLQYEEARTRRRAVWQSIESNLSGYDVLSIVAAENDTPLSIEVKATRDRMSAARMHLSRNEWEVAVAKENHQVHLWVLGEQRFLAALAAEELRPHIPADGGRGKWESVDIPFAAFSTRFQRVVFRDGEIR